MAAAVDRDRDVKTCLQMLWNSIPKCAFWRDNSQALDLQVVQVEILRVEPSYRWRVRFRTGKVRESPPGFRTIREAKNDAVAFIKRRFAFTG
jgi:hypothetical protein